MVNVVESFSYGLKDIQDITQAKDKARQQGQKFSAYLVDLIKQDLKKKTY